jgi:hypothetical protein
VSGRSDLPNVVLSRYGLSPLLADDPLVGHVALVAQDHSLHVLQLLTSNFFMFLHKHGYFLPAVAINRTFQNIKNNF